MKRMPPYSMIQVALPIHLTLPPRVPGIGSPVMVGSFNGDPVNVDPVNVDNLSEGRVSVLDMMKLRAENEKVEFVMVFVSLRGCDDVTIWSSDLHVTVRGNPPHNTLPKSDTTTIDFRLTLGNKDYTSDAFYKNNTASPYK
jgi:hypothetical protein